MWGHERVLLETIRATAGGRAPNLHKLFFPAFSKDEVFWASMWLVYRPTRLDWSSYWNLFEQSDEIHVDVWIAHTIESEPTAQIHSPLRKIHCRRSAAAPAAEGAAYRAAPWAGEAGEEGRGRAASRRSSCARGRRRSGRAPVASCSWASPAAGRLTSRRSWRERTPAGQRTRKTRRPEWQIKWFATLYL